MYTPGIVDNFFYCTYMTGIVDGFNYNYKYNYNYCTYTAGVVDCFFLL